MAAVSRSIARLNADELLERARQLTGLTDFGDPWFLEPFHQLVAAINQDAGLPSLDVPPVQTLVENLADRLRLTAYLKRYPETRDEKVQVAGVIVAHARGGSTLLQRLLTASPQLTAPRWWELITPIPLADELPGDPAPRIAIANSWIKVVNEMAPDHASIHPLDAMAYEEEIMLINHSFLSMMYSAYFNLPNNNLWQMTQDHSKSYSELKLWLQVLQHQAPERRGRRWLLKAVQHLMTGNLETLLSEFPDARLIMTHRHLENVLASLCSAQAMLIKVSQSQTFDQRSLGPIAMTMYERALRNMMALRARNPAVRFIDVRYEDLTANPAGQFRRIMEQLGLSVTAADEAAASDWIAQNPRGSFPSHHYFLEDFGLSRSRIKSVFDFYDKAFLS